MVELDPNKEEHPARRASLLSRECVHSHDKEGWLGLFAEDGIIQDPIGTSPLDPNGEGHKTPAQREAFWDQNIANSDIEITIHHSYAAANEVANHLTLDVVVPLGDKKFRQQTKGIFTYRVDERGKIAAMRGYWDFDESMKTMKEVGG